MSFVFETLKSNDLTEVNDFLIKHFFSREPLGLRLGIKPESDVSEWLSQVTQPLLDQQVSCKVTKNGELVGLCLNKIDYLEETKRIPSFAEAVEGRDIFMNKILEFMDILYKDIDLFETCQVDKMFVINMICVSPKEAGQGLASKMMDWSENMAKKSKITIMTSETTGIASSKIMEKSKCTKVKFFLYDDYKDKNGEYPFANMKPHLGCTIWKKTLDLSTV